MKNTPGDTVDYSHMQTLMLEKIRFNMSQIVGKFTVESTTLTIDTYSEAMMHEFAIMFEAHIMGQKNKQLYQVWVDVPANWWQHFRLDHLPLSWREKRPVKMKKKYREFMVDHYALLPDWSKDIGQRVIMHTVITEPDIDIKD